jgi:hypothetical protein
MTNNNLNINLNSTVPLNSINYKSNQHRESFPYELDKIQPKMLQRDGMVMVKMVMIPMKSSSMVMTMATISPLQEGISSADFCLPESFFSLGVFRPVEAAEFISDPPSGLRFSRMKIYARGRWQKWARVATPLAGATRGLAAPPGGVGPWLLPSLSPSGYFRQLMKYEFLNIFLELLIFRNMVS